MFNNHKKNALLPSMRRWDNWFDSMLGKLELFPGEELHPDQDDWLLPEIDVTDQAATVRLALPGRCKKDLSVEIENDLLTIRSEQNAECAKACKEKKFLRKERVHSEIVQRFRLPGAVKAEHAKAVYSDGILTVSIPREQAPSEIARKIEVK